MIPVQKDFPPELIRRCLRKQFKNRWNGLHDYAVRCQRRENFRQWMEQWKLSQNRQQWLYAVIGGALLCLIVFVISGGCR